MEVAEIQRRSKSGPIILIARRFLAVVIGFLSTIAISRLLPPTAFGLAAMSTVIFALAGIFKDFGLTSAMMRKGHLTHEDMSFLFWANAALTAVVSAVVFLITPEIALFFKEPIVRWIVYASLIGFALGGFSSQHYSLLSRNLRFGQIAMIDTGAQVAGLVVTFILALVRHDVWALVIGNMVQAITGSAATVIVSRWKPGPPRRSADLKDLAHFGLNSSIFSLSIFLSTNISTILIGHFLSTASLGQFTRANALYALPATNVIEPIIQATLPVLARYRPYPDLYRQTYLSMVRMLSVCLMPASLVLFFAAPAIVTMLLGPKWSATGLALRALSPAICGLGLAYAIGDLFVTQNRSAEMRNLGLLEVVMRVGIIWIGVQFGLVAAAAGVSVATLLVVPMRLFTIGRSGPITVMDQVSAAAPGVPVGLGAAAAAMPMWLLTEHFTSSATIQAGMIVVAGGIGGLGIGLLWPVSRQALLDLAGTFVPKLARPA
jgi:PST family polysaccharide transporter